MSGARTAARTTRAPDDLNTMRHGDEVLDEPPKGAGASSRSHTCYVSARSREEDAVPQALVRSNPCASAVRKQCGRR